MAQFSHYLKTHYRNTRSKTGRKTKIHVCKAQCTKTWSSSRAGLPDPFYNGNYLVYRHLDFPRSIELSKCTARSKG